MTFGLYSNSIQPIGMDYTNNAPNKTLSSAVVHVANRNNSNSASIPGFYWFTIGV